MKANQTRLVPLHRHGKPTLWIPFENIMRIPDASFFDDEEKIEAYGFGDTSWDHWEDFCLYQDNSNEDLIRLELFRTESWADWATADEMESGIVGETETYEGFIVGDQVVVYDATERYSTETICYQRHYAGNEPDWDDEELDMAA